MSRERSLWAWGWADRFPDDDARRGLAQHAAAAARDRAARPPPAADARDDPHARRASRRPGSWRRSRRRTRLDRAMHAHGKSYRDVARAFAGDFRAAPDVVAFPRDEDDVAAVLAWCGRERLAAFPFGGGTSVVGGVERPRATRGAAPSRSIFARWTACSRSTPCRAPRASRPARGPAVEEQLAAHGLTLRHYPQSFEHSTLGGWIATRAGGHFATLYTHVDDLVESVRMVTPRGRLRDEAPARLRRGARARAARARLGGDARRHHRGVDAGASAAAVPGVGERALRGFASRERAGRGPWQTGLYPSNCRLLDPREALLHGVMTEGGAVLLLAFESADHSMRALDRPRARGRAARRRDVRRARRSERRARRRRQRARRGGRRSSTLRTCRALS